MSSIHVVPTLSGVQRRCSSQANHTTTGFADGAALESKRILGSSTVDSTKSYDPFLYFSNNDNRLKFETPPRAAPSADGPQEQETTGVQRKTRISFEMHPGWLLDDMLEDDALLQEDLLGERFDLDVDIRDVTMIDSLQKVELLRELLRL